MNTGKVLVGVLASLAAGVVIGVLFAPDKGSETRKKISKKSCDTMDELKEKFNELVASVTEKFDDLKEETGDLLEKSKHKMEDFKKDARTSMS